MDNSDIQRSQVNCIDENVVYHALPYLYGNHKKNGLTVLHKAVLGLTRLVRDGNPCFSSPNSHFLAEL